MRLFLVLLACSVSAQAVTVFRADPSPVMTTAGATPPGGFPALYAVAGASINICNDAACVTPATTYADSGGSVVCPVTAPVVLAGSSLCTPTTGPQGQFGFWLAPGVYYYRVTFPGGQTFGTYPISGNIGVTGVSAFNSRIGSVMPQTGDYTATQVGLGNLTNNAQVVDPAAPGIVVRTSPGASRVANSADIAGIFNGITGTPANHSVMLGTGGQAAGASGNPALGFLPFVSGGTGSDPGFLNWQLPATVVADAALVGNSSTAVIGKALPSCPDSGGNHLNYALGGSFTCGTSGGGGGGGAGTFTQLLDFNIINTSGPVQQMGASCVLCMIGQGAVNSAPLTGPVTATLSGTSVGGVNDAWWYFTSSLALTVGHNTASTVTCSAGCAVATGITGFPADSTPLWHTTFTSLVWNTITPVSMDKRTTRRSVIVPGAGNVSSTDPTTGIQTVSADPTITPRYFTSAGAPGGSCTAGRDFDTDITNLHLYFCDAANTWKQADIGGGGVTDSSFQMFPTASAINGTGNTASGWTSDTALVAPYGNSGFYFISIAKATGAHFAYVPIRVPVGWTGAVKVRSNYYLAANSTGLGTGNHDYSLACYVPGTTDVYTAGLSWQTPVVVAFNVSSFTAGAVDVPVFSGGSIPSCSPGTLGSETGALLFVRIIRENAGTATDDTKLFGFEVALPHTVQ